MYIENIVEKNHIEELLWTQQEVSFQKFKLQIIYRVAIYFYVMIINIKGLIIPINEMISEKHDTNTIEYWIKEWLRMSTNKLEEAISDYSRALLGAMTSAFNRMTIKRLFKECCSMLFCY